MGYVEGVICKGKKESNRSCTTHALQLGGHVVEQALSASCMLVPCWYLAGTFVWVLSLLGNPDSRYWSTHRLVVCARGLVPLALRAKRFIFHVVGSPRIVSYLPRIVAHGIRSPKLIDSNGEDGCRIRGL